MQKAISHPFALLAIAALPSFAAIQPDAIPVPVPTSPPTVITATPTITAAPVPVFVVTPEIAALIAPDELSAIYETGMGTADYYAYSVTRRLSALRASRFTLDAPVTGKSSNYKDVIAADGKTTVDSKGVQVAELESRWGAFLIGGNSHIDIENGSFADGYGVTGRSVTLGIDYRVSERLTLGVLLGYTDSEVDLHGGDISANTGTLGVYGSWVDQGFYVNGLIAGSYSSYDINRRAFGGNTHGDTDGESFSGLLSTGYDFQHNDWVFGPFVDLQYTTVQFDGYREDGSVFPLEIDDNRSDSLRSRLGARISRMFTIGSARICPELALSWQHEYLDSSRPIDSSFTSTGKSFRVEGPVMGRDSLVVNATMTFLHNDRWSSFVGYDATLGRDDYEAHTVSGGVRVNF